MGRPRSASPSDSLVTPSSLGPEEQLEEDRKKEDESHEALIEDSGRPCYPIELGFGVFDNPGQYRDILEYWQREDSSDRLVFSAQLFDWKDFRSRQQHNRRRYVSRDRFFKFQEVHRDRRRKYGLDGDVHLREKVADQSKLEDWMEYQNYELQNYEILEKGLKESQEELASYRKALAEEGYSAFEEIENIEFGKYYGMTLDWGSKKAKAKTKWELAERKLRVAKARSDAVQLEQSEEIERDRWIGWFEKELISRRTKMKKLKPLADKARRDVVPYEQWFNARIKEFDVKYGEFFRDSDEGRRLVEVEVKTAEFWSKFDKQKELLQRAHEAEMAHFRAEREVKFSEEVLEAARTEDLAPIVERAALIRRTQKEVRFAEFHVEEEKESTRVLDLKENVINALGSITSLKDGMKRLKILLDWIEQQRRELVGDSVNAGRKSGPRRSTRVNSRARPSSLATKASKVDHPAQKRARRQKTTTKSISDPVDPSKVFKTPRQSQKARRRTSVPHNILPAVERTNADFNNAEPKSDTAVPIKDGMDARLRHVHSSRISKLASNRPNGRQKDTTRPSSLRDRHRWTSKETMDVSTLNSPLPSLNDQR